MKKIEVFETSDGKICRTQAEAEAAELRLTLRAAVFDLLNNREDIIIGESAIEDLFELLATRAGAVYQAMGAFYKKECPKVQAIKLVLGLDGQPDDANVPGYKVRLDPQA